jgi:gamma-glutamyltranspeptidase/glutathione hydrolase
MKEPVAAARWHAVFAGLFVGLLLQPLSTPTLAKESLAAARPPGNAIASAHRLATEAGQEILAQGGNAFDAAIAVSAALSVVEPVSSGIGGGGFFLLHDARSGKDVFVDAREVAPHFATPAFYLDSKGELDRDKAENGAASAGIPGLPAGLVHISKKYGRLPLAQSLAPAIRIARQGFEIYDRIARQYGERRVAMERYASTRAVYLADGDAPEVGETLQQPDLARTLERLGRGGFDGFYRGETARAILATVAADGVNWTAEELAAYRVKERAPIRFKYRGWDIVTAPPPSSGGIVLAEALQILEGWNLAELGEAQRAHLMIEALRRAYRDRTFQLGDPDFHAVPVRLLSSDDYAAGLRAGILPDKATPSAMLPGQPAPKDSVNTTHFSIIDAEGNYVAATQTVNLSFGSGLVVAGAGFLLNDEMDDFALRPGTPNAYGVMGFDANAVAPGKRMLSSMSPSFKIGEDRVAVLGAKGGSRIITAVLQGMLALEAGMDSSRIVALPRLHHQYLPDRVFLEANALSPGAQAALRGMGHELSEWNGPVVLMQSVDWDRRNGELHGASDPRNPVGAAIVAPARKAAAKR